MITSTEYQDTVKTINNLDLTHYQTMRIMDNVFSRAQKAKDNPVAKTQSYFNEQIQKISNLMLVVLDAHNKGRANLEKVCANLLQIPATFLSTNYMTKQDPHFNHAVSTILNASKVTLSIEAKKHLITCLMAAKDYHMNLDELLEPEKTANTVKPHIIKPVLRNTRKEKEPTPSETENMPHLGPNNSVVFTAQTPKAIRLNLIPEHMLEDAPPTKRRKIAPPNT